MNAKTILSILICAFLLPTGCISDMGATPNKVNQNNYQGIWFQQFFKSGESKYAGGMATYSEKHRPIAIYHANFNKTFFVFGGVNEQSKNLVIRAGYYDHHTNSFSNPVQIWEKPTKDPHENAVLSLDESGYIYVFANAHGNKGESKIFKSLRPGDISDFQMIEPILAGENIPFKFFSYMQVWYSEKSGFLGVFTRYGHGAARTLCFAKSTNGETWTDFKVLAAMEEGSYHISTFQTGKLFIAFDRHPKDRNGPGIDYRSNLYLIYSDDQGETWRSYQNEATLSGPLQSSDNIALVLDTDQRNNNLYLKDMIIESNGKPIILISTKNRTSNSTSISTNSWYVMEWSSGFLQSHMIGLSDHDFDMGAMKLVNDTLKIISAMDMQSGFCGGPLNIHYIRLDNFSIIQQRRELSFENTNYFKAVLNGIDDFSFLWSTGNPTKYSECSLYFLNQNAIHMIQ